MIGLHGWSIVGTSADAPGCAQELLRDPQGRLHVGLGFLHSHPDLEGLLDQMEAAEDLLRTPAAPHVAPLVHRDADHATFFYAVEDGALLSTFLQVRAAMGQPAGPRAAAELLAAVGRLLEALEQGPSQPSLQTHGAIHPWRLMVHPTGSVTLVGFGLPSFEIENQSSPLRFLPPERLWEEQLDLRGDIYTAGICALELAIGAPLLEGSPDAVEALILDGEVPRRVEGAREQLGEPLSELLLACVAPEPSSRISTGADLRERAAAVLPELESHPSLFALVAPLAEPEHEGRRLLDVQRGLRVLDTIRAFFDRLTGFFLAPFRRNTNDDRRGASIPFDMSDEAPTVAFDDPERTPSGDGVMVVARNLLEPTREGLYRMEDAEEVPDPADADPDWEAVVEYEDDDAEWPEDEEPASVEDLDPEPQVDPPESEQVSALEEADLASTQVAPVPPRPADESAISIDPVDPFAWPADADFDDQVTLPVPPPAPDPALRDAARASASSAQAWLDRGLREASSALARSTLTHQIGDLTEAVQRAHTHATRASERYDDACAAPIPERAPILEDLGSAAKLADEAANDARRLLFRLRAALAPLEEKEASIKSLLREADDLARSARRLVVEVEQTEGALSALVEHDASLSANIEPSLKRLRFAATWAQRAAQRAAEAAARGQEVTSPEDAHAVVEEAKKGLDDTIAAWRRVGKEDKRARRSLPPGA